MTVWRPTAIELSSMDSVRGCDLVVDTLLTYGVDTFFVITGGAIVSLIDAVHRADGTAMFAFQHEQAATMAAEGYWRETGKLGCVLVTSGPGVQNTLNGVCGCYYDSVPLLLISGQVNTSESLDAISSKPRQRGFQEMPVVECFGAFCKYADRILYSLDSMGGDIQRAIREAVNAAMSPRFGPAMIDLPVNIQMSQVYSLALPMPSPLAPANIQDAATGQASKVVDMLVAAERPVVIFGSAVRASGSIQLAHSLIEKTGLPFVLSWCSKDIFEAEHPGNLGTHGVYGSRAANLAVQSADLLLILGSRMDTRQTGGNLKVYAPTAKKVMVDIDVGEIGKLIEKGIDIELKIICELKSFMTALVGEVPPGNQVQPWIEHTALLVATYEKAAVDNAVKYKSDKAFSVYTFLEALDAKIPHNATIVPDQGGNLCWSMQTLKARGSQRIYTNLGNSSMGFALPCCIGSAVGAGDRPVLCIDGDGGFQMNIQELKTVMDYKLPIKTFILNNSGYGIIKQFQDLYFEKRHVVTEFAATDFCAIAQAYGMHAIRITKDSDLDAALDEVFGYDGPVLADVIVEQDQKIFPKLEFGNALEHMTPFIPIEELEQAMRAPLALRKEPKGWVQATP